MMNMQTESLTVQYLSAEDLSIAASLIYQAYHDDPVLQKLLNFNATSPSGYEKKLRALIREELNSFWQHQQPLVGLYNNQRLKAVACVIASNHEVPAERFWHWRLKLMLNAGYLQTNQLIEKEKTIREALTSFKQYYYLAFIAVDPHFHGQGYGRHLLRGLNDLTKSTPASAGIAVFVTRNEHVAFFRSEGFAPFKQLVFNQVQGDLLFKAVE